MRQAIVGAAGNGNYKLDCPRGNTWHLALTGTRVAAVVKVQFATGVGTFADWSTPKSLSAVGEMTGANIGEHSDLRLNVASAGVGDDLIAIFTVVPIR